MWLTLQKKASNTLNFTCRNLKYCPRKTIEMAYVSLVCSTLDYSTSVCDSHLKKDQTKLEMINRRSAHFVMNDYNSTSSLSGTTVDYNILDSFNAHLYKYLSAALTPSAGYPTLGVCRLSIQIQIHSLKSAVVFRLLLKLTE